MIKLDKIIDGLEMVDDIIDCYYNPERNEIFLSNIGEYEELTEDEIYTLNKENIYLSKIITTLKKTVNKFIKWIVKKFDIAEEDNLIRDFEKETRTFIDPEKQLKKEEREKEWDLEI